MFYALHIKTPCLASSRARQLQAHFLFLSVCLRLTDNLQACRAATVFLNFCFCVLLSSSNPRCIDTPHLALRHCLITIFTFAIAIAITIAIAIAISFASAVVIFLAFAITLTSSFIFAITIAHHRHLCLSRHRLISSTPQDPSQLRR